jgi:hypothetical protein
MLPLSLKIILILNCLYVVYAQVFVLCVVSYAYIVDTYALVSGFDLDSLREHIILIKHILLEYDSDYAMESNLNEHNTSSLVLCSSNNSQPDYEPAHPDSRTTEGNSGTYRN